MVSLLHIPDVTEFRAALERAIDAEDREKIITARRDLTSQIEEVSAPLPTTIVGLIYGICSSVIRVSSSFMTQRQTEC